MSEHMTLQTKRAAIDIILSALTQVHQENGLHMCAISYPDPDENNHVHDVNGKFVFGSEGAALLGVQLWLDLFKKSYEGKEDKVPALVNCINAIEKTFHEVIKAEEADQDNPQ